MGSRAKRNPAIGEHPDLFEPKPTRVFRSLSSLTPEQILALPRAAFTAAEWDELDEDVQEAIYEGDAGSKARIAKLAQLFINAYKWETDPPEDYVIEREGEYFDQWLAEEDNVRERVADRLERHARDDNWIDDIYAEYRDRGFTDTQIDAALDEALKDTNNWELRKADQYDGGHIFSGGLSGEVYVHGEDIAEALEGMYPDEIERAIEEINQEAWDGFVTADAIQKAATLHRGPGGSSAYYPDFSRSVETDVALVADPDEEKIREAVAESLNAEAPEPAVPELPPEERVLHRFKDGSYVIDLLPGELPDEGKQMGICVGRREMGYARRVKDSEIKILSLRTANGRPKFTIEVKLDRDGDMQRIEQVKGKANRLPGFDPGKTGQGKVKEDEVSKLVEFFDAVGLDPRDAYDMQPALRALKLLPGMRENPARRCNCHCGFCCKHK